jgi:TonB-linked SusC/RagA family outer membrane protein
MTRILSLFVVFMLTGVLAFSQTRTVTGKVTEADGTPISYSTIKIQGSKVGGLATDANGSYTLKASATDVLEVTASGFKAANVTVGNVNSMTIVLERTADLKEVVVTGAFGLKKQGRSSSGNIQSITSEQLNTVRQSNINNAIAGKVAGAQVRSQSAAALGRETIVRLRGENGLGVGSGALYVVDGTILPSGGDINPDDVEDVSVLQGPAAAALFGPDGSNGAIVVTTKKAKKSANSRLGVEFNSAIVFDKVYITPNYQNSYAGGSGSDLIQYNYRATDPVEWKNLDGKYYHNYDDDASWGPRIMNQEYIPWYAWYGGHSRAYQTAKMTAQPNNVRDYFNTGVTKTNNISFSKANDYSSFRVSYTNLDINGVIPNSYLKRHTINTNFSFDVTSKLTLSSNINVISQTSNSESDDGYSNASSGSFNQWFHRELDINILKELRGLKTPSGVYASWNISNPTDRTVANPDNWLKGNYWANPFTYFDLVKNISNRTRLFGDIAATYKFNNNFRVKATYRRQELSTNGSNIYPSELQNSGTQISFNPYNETTAEGVLASYQTGSATNLRQNVEGLAIFEKKFKNFSTSATVGFDFLTLRNRSYNANTSGGLVIPGVYSLANSVAPLRNSSGTGANAGQFEVITELDRRSIFATTTIGFRNYLFVDGTFRKDYTSAEPIGTSIDTKSIGASFIASDVIPKNDILSYAKFRASYGQILNTLNAYDLGTYYTISSTVNANAVITEPNTLINPRLSGATNTEKEIGVELRFLKSRFGITATVWDRTNKNFPVNVSIPQGTGYSGYRTNAGELAKQGVDLQAYVEVIRKENTKWRLTGTWGRLIKNEIVSIDAEGKIPSIITGGGAFSANGGGTRAAWIKSEVGQKWGQLTGTGIKRDANGTPVLNSDGTFASQQGVNYGSVLPDYTGGVQSSLTLFKHFTVNINIDYSYGGKFFSLSDFWGSFSGLSARTAVLNDKGNSIRDAVSDGGGVHVTGVDATTLKPVDYYVDAQTYFHQFNGSNISEASVYDLTFVKLREFSLGYIIPMEKLGLGKVIKGATFSIIARNPVLLYSKTKDFDPSEISNSSGEDGQYPGTRSVGVNLKLNF